MKSYDHLSKILAYFSQFLPDLKSSKSDRQKPFGGRLRIKIETNKDPLA